MRITGNVVHKVGKFAQDFTGKAFVFQAVGGDIGHGARYFDGIRQQVWIGRGASSEAAAYYIGGMLGWAQASGSMIPDDVREFCQEVQQSYARNAKTDHWEQQGRDDATYRFQSRRERSEYTCVARPCKRYPHTWIPQGEEAWVPVAGGLKESRHQECAE